MKTLAEWREKLQGPRRSADTWYGRRVMRPLSIHLTLFFGRFGVPANTVTCLSFLAAVAGFALLVNGRWGPGILMINFWYLLDHVDGELSRYYERSTATGFFLDTFANFIVQPLTFYGLGWGLQAHGGRAALALGMFGAFSYMIFIAFPMCEAMIVFYLGQWRRRVPAEDPAGRDHSGRKPSAAGRIFGWIHRQMTYPYALCVLTLIWAVSVLTGGAFRLEPAMIAWMAVYAAGSALVWMAQLAERALTGRLDRHPFLSG